MNILCEFQDGTTHTARVLAIDVVVMERKFKVSAPAEGQRLAFEPQCFLAYNALKRDGTVEKAVTFDAFLADVLADIADADEAEEGGGPLPK